MISGDVCKHFNTTILPKCPIVFIPWDHGNCCSRSLSWRYKQFSLAILQWGIEALFVTSCQQISIFFLPITRLWCTCSRYQNEAKGLQRRSLCCCPVGRCTPNLRCFCEISVCTVVALNCKPFQSVQIFVWLCFDISDKFIWMQTAESRQRLCCLMKPRVLFTDSRKQGRQSPCTQHNYVLTVLLLGCEGNTCGSFFVPKKKI